MNAIIGISSGLLLAQYAADGTRRAGRACAAAGGHNSCKGRRSAILNGRGAMFAVRYVLLMIAFLASIGFAGCKEKAPAPSPAATGPKGENQMKAIKLTSPAFQPGEPI